MARPTKYSKHIITKTHLYLLECKDEYVTETRDKIENGKVVGKEEFRRLKVNVPTLEGLAFRLGVHKDTIQEWKKEHEEFSVLIARLLAKQAEALVNKGLSGDYNPTIAKVLLTKHGYREGLDHTTDDKPIAPTPESIAKANEALDAFINSHANPTPPSNLPV